MTRTNDTINKPVHPSPTAPGYFWAKLVDPRNEPEDEDWISTDFEVVHVDENYGEGEDEFRVYVTGIGPGQLIDAFIWGARIPDYDPTNDQQPTEQVTA